MRRGNFLIVIGVAIITYFSLTAFLGRRPWMGYRHWHRAYYGRCERGDSSRQEYRYNHDEGNKPARERQIQPDSNIIQK